MRVALTLAAVLLGIAFNRLCHRHICAREWSNARQREVMVSVRNLIVVAVVVGVFAIWASRIAGFALSLAALGGGMLIVSKELLANLLGFLMLSLVRPYKVGDYVEVAGTRGRVCDISTLATSIIETQEAHQLTGRRVTVPNSVLLSTPARNITATGDYVMHLMPLLLPPTIDILATRAALLKAAETVCSQWVEAAEAHLSEVEERELMDLPSAAPRVLIEFSDPKAVTLAVRYTAPARERINVEQAILELFLRESPQFAARPETDGGYRAPQSARDAVPAALLALPAK